MSRLNSITLIALLTGSVTHCHSFHSLAEGEAYVHGGMRTINDTVLLPITIPLEIWNTSDNAEEEIKNN